MNKLEDAKKCLPVQRSRDEDSIKVHNPEESEKETAEIARMKREIVN